MHLPCRTVLHCCSSLGKGKGDSEEEHTEAAVARLPWILPSARAAIATDQPAQQGLLLEESRLSPLRPRSQFVFLAAGGLIDQFESEGAWLAQMTYETVSKDVEP